MKKLLAFLGITGTVMLGAPVVPQDLAWQYAYQTTYESQFIEYPEPSAPLFIEKPEPRPVFPDDNGDGMVSVAVFTNRAGERVYKQIPETQYRDMGKKEGHLKNPKDAELVTLFQAMKPQFAEAAIAYSTSTWAATNAGAASSITFIGPSISALDNTVMWVNPVIRTQTDRSISSVTYNGDAFTDTANNARNGTQFAAYAVEAAQWYMAAPDTGGYYNVVITLSGAADGASPYINGFVSVYDGAAQTGTLDSSGKVEQGGSQTSATAATTVVGDTCWLVGVALDNTGSIAGGSAGANTTFRTGGAVANAKGADSNGIQAAGSRSLVWNRSADNADQVGVASSFCEPAAVAATPDLINLIIFE